MQSMTWPSGLERPALPSSCRSRPLPNTVRVCEPILREEDSGVHVSHVAAWCVAGSIGWAAAIASGWLAITVLGPLIP